MENDYPLYPLLKNLNFVESFKEYSHLVYNRQVKVNDKVIEDPKFKPVENTSTLQVGLRKIQV